eukprot:scaffold96856_cov54-Attheya_sp.AAC.2
MSVSVGQAASLPLPPSGDQIMADADPENDAVDGEMESEDDDEEEEEDDFGIEEEQLEEYKEILERMGKFADKVTVNSLSMVAEDHADSPSSAAAIYGCIRDPLLSPTVAAGCKLPLVYVMDSILKNVKGEYIKLIEEDAHEWMPVVHKALGEEQRAKLKRVWNTWREFRIFPEDKLKRMGQCFVDAEQDARSARLVTEAKAKAAGMGRRKDGTLDLSPPLRRQMQLLLDEVQSTGLDELDKVSLERLADINPSLLTQIKKAAEEGLMETVGTAVSAVGGGNAVGGVGLVVPETRPPYEVKRAQEWDKFTSDYLMNSNKVIRSLQHSVRVGSTSFTPTTAAELQQKVGLLSAASASAAQLTNMLERLKAQQDTKENNFASSNNAMYSTSGAAQQHHNSTGSTKFMAIDPNKFTNEGLKEKSENVIAGLYEVGLPFSSSSDGRRFATQIELSKHLDALFRRREVEKSMERTDEREWYNLEAVWVGRASATDAAGGAGTDAANMSDEAAAEANPDLSTVSADELRDKCAICGINFKMCFDNEDGEYKYKNCCEVEVLNDEASAKESEQMLVHVTCLRGLGSPDSLTKDQVLLLDE